MDISLLLRRVQTVEHTLAILEGQFNDPECDIEEKCIDLFTSLVELEEMFSRLRQIMKDTTDQVNIMEVRVKQLRGLRKHIAHIKSQLPEEESVNVFGAKCLDMGGNETNLSDGVSPVPKSWAHLESPKEPPPKSKMTAPKSEKRFPSIAHISEAEMENVPKYMKGRLNYSNINKVIDTLNIAFKKKYEVLSRPKKSIKGKDLDYYCEWKQTENLEPKGTYFITIKDVNTFGHVKLDKTALNIVTILRHLKLLRETRHANNHTHFIVA